MKKRKVLGGILFSLALITLITLIMFFREKNLLVNVRLKIN